MLDLDSISSMNVMGHEVRTKLGTMLGFIELLGELNLSEEDRLHYVEILRKNGKMLLNLINDGLDIDKIEKGNFELEAEPASISSILEDVLNRLEFEAAKRNLKLKIEATPKDFPKNILADVLRVQQIISSLLRFCINNTIRKNVGIGLSSNEKFVRIQVCGAFQTVKPSEGDKLRLIFVKRLATAMGGIFQFESENEEVRYILDLPNRRIEEAIENLPRLLAPTS